MLFITKKATDEETAKMMDEYGDYIKVVVDIEKEILAGGAAMHYQEERLLFEYGCKQSNLWGGGVYIKDKRIVYDSMINVRPNQDNPSREILDKSVRAKFDKIVKKLLLYE